MQILLVIYQDTKATIVRVYIKYSYIWPQLFPLFFDKIYNSSIIKIVKNLELIYKNCPIIYNNVIIMPRLCDFPNTEIDYGPAIHLICPQLSNSSFFVSIRVHFHNSSAFLSLNLTYPYTNLYALTILMTLSPSSLLLKTSENKKCYVHLVEPVS